MSTNKINKYSWKISCVYTSPVLSPVPKESADTHRHKQQAESPTAGGSKTQR